MVSERKSGQIQPLKLSLAQVQGSFPDVLSKGSVCCGQNNGGGGQSRTPHLGTGCLDGLTHIKVMLRGMVVLLLLLILAVGIRWALVPGTVLSGVTHVNSNPHNSPVR